MIMFFYLFDMFVNFITIALLLFIALLLYSKLYLLLHNYSLLKESN